MVLIKKEMNSIINPIFLLKENATFVSNKINFKCKYHFFVTEKSKFGIFKLHWIQELQQGHCVLELLWYVHYVLNTVQGLKLTFLC